MGYGPVQMLAIGFDGNHFRGEIMPELERLKGAGVVRIIDLLLVRKDSNGAIAHLTASDLDWQEAVKFGEAMGALAGFAADGLGGVEGGGLAGMAELMDGHLFDEQDAFKLEQLLTNNTTAAVVLIEHLWAAPLLEAIGRANGFELMNEWVRPEQLMAAGGRFASARAEDTEAADSGD
ncbi:MAG TPA: hypothetical protein VIE18_04350 [Gaiellaceae bacterium]|jgi:hypothetical protein